MNVIAGTTASAALWCSGKSGLIKMLSILAKLDMGLQYVPFASHMKHLELLRKVPVVSTERLILKEWVFWFLTGKPDDASETYKAVRRMFPNSDDIRYSTFPGKSIQATGEIASTYEQLVEVYKVSQISRLYFDSTHSQTAYNGAKQMCNGWKELYKYIEKALSDGLRVGIHLQPLRFSRKVPLGATVFYRSDSLENLWILDPADPYVNLLAILRGSFEVPIIIELPINMSFTPAVYEENLEKTRNAIHRVLGTSTGFI